MKCILFFSLFICSFIIWAQVPEIEWSRCYGGSNEEHRYNFVKQTKDGGYIVASATSSTDGDVNISLEGYMSIWIFKLDSERNIVWQQSFGDGDINYVYSISQTADNGYIFLAHIRINDLAVFKLNEFGELEWMKLRENLTSIGALNNVLMLPTIQQTFDGGYVFSEPGQFFGQNKIIKLNSIGNTEWELVLSGCDIFNHSRLFKIIQTLDGGYALAGMAAVDDENGCMDSWLSGWVVKLDNSGILEWEKYIGGENFYTERQFTDIAQADDGSFILTGTATDQLEWDKYDVWVVKLDVNGNLVWQNKYGGSHVDVAYSIQPTDDGYIVAGISNSNDGDISGWHEGYNQEYRLTDILVMKLDFHGEINWFKMLGGTKNDTGSLPFEIAPLQHVSIQQTDDKGYILSGNSFSNDGDVYGNHGIGDIWIVKIKENMMGNEEQYIHSVSIYPNPAKDIIFFDDLKNISEINIYDLNGKLIKSEKHKENYINISKLSSGTYLLELITEEGKGKTTKFIKK